MLILRSLALILGVSLFVTAAPWAQNDDSAPRTNPTIKVEMANGDVLTGELLESNDESIVIQHPELGVIVIPRSALNDPGAEALALAVLMPDGSEEGVVEPVSPWSGEADFGLDGSYGNTQNRNVLINAKIVREREADRWATSYFWSKKRDSQTKTEDRMELKSIYEWLEPDSPWLTYVQGTAEKDEFRDFDYRYTANVGRGYEFIKNDTTRSVGRVGVGARYQDGGEDDGTDPEGLVAWDFTHDFDDRQNFESLVSWAPLLNDTGDYIYTMEAAYKIALKDDTPWYLKMGADWDFESRPGDAKASDLTYFLALGRKF